MAAFRRAIEMGASFIETDLQLTRDARFVAMHDETLERTTSGIGPVHEWTLADLRELDAGSWFGSQYAGERIPTLDEILQFARETDVVFYLELKSFVAWGAEHALVGALRKAEEIARTVVLSFDAATLAALHHLEPMLMTGLLIDTLQDDPIERAVASGARQLAVRGDLVTPALLAEARCRDLQVVAWTVNHPAHMRALTEAGVNGIITDYPDRLVVLQRG